MDTYITEYKHGKIILLRNDLISYIINTNGEWCDAEVDLFRSILIEGDSVIEIGANIGSHSIPISKSIGTKGRLFCFEPQRIIFQILCGNMAINGLSNTFAYQMAVGEADCNISLPGADYYEERKGISNFGAVSLLDSFSSQETSKSTRLDDHVFEGGLSSLRLIKIDVEGMEPNVIQGAQQIITEYKPILFIEANSNRRHLFEIISHLDYNCYWFCNKYYNTNNFFSNPINILGNEGDADFLCVPKSLEMQPNFLPKVHEQDAFDTPKSQIEYQELSGKIPMNWLHG